MDALQVQPVGAPDDGGYLDVTIPPNAKGGTLTLDQGTPDETVIPLQLGHLDPLTEIIGVKQRLANLGLDCGDRTDEITDSLSAAVRAFQEMQPAWMEKLWETGARSSIRR